MTTPLRILHLEDDPKDAELIRATLEAAGFAPEIMVVQTKADYLAQLDHGWELVLADYKLPQFDGLEALALFKERGLDISFILMSGTLGEEAAVAAMHAGASDYVLKNHSARLGPAVVRGLRETVERRARKQAEEALRRSEAETRQRLREIEQIYAHSPIGLFTCDREYRFERINERMAEINGFSVAHHLDKTLEEIVPDLASFLREAYRPIVERGESVLNVEIHGETPKDPGHKRDWIGNYFPLRSETGEVIGMMGAVLEMTERTQMERALAASDVFAHATIDALSAHMCVCDRTGTILTVNQAWRDFFDTTDAEQAHLTYGIGNNYLEICESASGPKADESESMAAGIRSVMEGRCGEFTLEYPCHSSTEQRWFVAKVTRFHDESGNIVVVHENVTAGKLSEMALRETKDRMASIVDAAMDAIITVDEMQRVVVFNAAASTLFRCSAAEAMGQSLGRFIPPRFRPGHAEQMRNFGKGQDTTRAMGRLGHVHGVRSNGEEFPAEASISHVEVQGRQLYSVILRDISDRIAAERQRDALEVQVREAQKMDALGTLAGGVAHDFNNILGVIIGNVDLASEEVHNPELVQVSLTEIARAGQRAKLLVDQILTFSRKEVQEFIDQPLRPILEETIRLLRATLPPVVRFNVTLAEAPLCARVDAAQLTQVLINLVTNAWHALNGSTGSIGLDLNAVELDEAAARQRENVPAGRYVHIAVSDDGQGMDAATQARVFEPFFTTKPKGRGTGLGLAVVHGIITAHHGAITLRSAPGEGSVFDIYLPARTTSDPVVPRVATPLAQHGSGRHVLYLDDNESTVFLMRRLLQKRGFRFSGFEVAEEALAAVRANPANFDLVVSDFNMPKASGLDVARAMREIRPDLPVVIVSGFVTEALRDDARAVGVRDVIHKPNSTEDLMAVITRLLSAS